MLEAEEKNQKQKGLYHSLYFSFMELLDFDPNLADFYMRNPDECMIWADTALYYAQTQLFNRINQKNKKLSKKSLCKSRPFGQLLYANNLRPSVSSIRSKDINHLIQIRGTIIRQSRLKVLKSATTFRCCLCEFHFTVHANINEEADVEHPKKCRNASTNCKSTKFEAIRDINIDFCEVYLQEQIGRIGLGKIPRSIRVVLMRDLCHLDLVKPGSDVDVIGIVRFHWNTIKTKKESRFDITMYIEAVSVQTYAKYTSHSKSSHHVSSYRNKFDSFWIENGSNPLDARNRILANLCPQLFGMYMIKLATALTIIGGVERIKYGTKIRGSSHLLLVGDPGTGKSQLLRYASSICDRSVLTTGVGTTSAGLTVSAVKDGGEWVLEAGALVLADGGICCIDEFGSIRENDRGVIHEAMEQQTISVAKGGFVCSLNSRCTVLAAMNPIPGGYEKGKQLALNTNVASSLLSRFDLILLLMDEKNSDWDKRVGQHLMDNLIEPEFPNIDYYDYDSQQNNNEHNKDNDDKYGSTAKFEQDHQQFLEEREDRVHWDMSQMKAYFDFIATFKSKKVKISDAATQILTEYFKKLRSNHKRDKSRTTVRLLESLIRLAQAHALLMYRSEVLALDAIETVNLMNASVISTDAMSDCSILQTVFPRDAKSEYEEKRAKILNMLFAKEWRLDKCAFLKEDDWNYREEIKKREIEEIAAFDESVFGEVDESDIFELHQKQNEDVENNNEENEFGENEDEEIKMEENEKEENDDCPPGFGQRKKRNRNETNIEHEMNPNQEQITGNSFSSNNHNNNDNNNQMWNDNWDFNDVWKDDGEKEKNKQNTNKKRRKKNFE